MKVLHIISSGGMYGAEAVILNLLRVMKGGGQDSAVVGIFLNAMNPNRQFYEAATREGFESRWISCSGQLDRHTISTIRELASSERADVIHAHGYKADIYCRLAMRGTGVPLVSTCHTWYDTDLFLTFYGKLDRLVLRSFARIVAVSEEVKQRLLKAGVSADKICIVRNGIDLKPFDGRQSIRTAGDGRDLVVGLVGRLAWEKGVDLFLAAAAQVVSEFPNVQFVVIGEGPDRDKLEAMIGKLGLGEKFVLQGHREDMPAAYASLDLMVSASRQEGLPVAMLEGMASRLPLVATAVGEVPKLVMDGKTGLLVPSEDAGALASAMLAMMRDAGLRERLGAAARELVEDEYSAERMATEYRRVYDEAIATMPRRTQ